MPSLMRRRYLAGIFVKRCSQRPPWVGETGKGVSCFSLRGRSSLRDDSVDEPDFRRRFMASSTAHEDSRFHRRSVRVQQLVHVTAVIPQHAPLLASPARGRPRSPEGPSSNRYFVKFGLFIRVQPPFGINAFLASFTQLR